MLKYEIPITYAVKHKDNDIRMKSRSGGIFTALTDYVLNENGKVYGCILNEKFEAIHIGTSNMKERNKMRGSKYVQSRLGNTFKEIKKDLDSRKKVLFSGTPCQIDGLLAFLGKDYDDLICIDIVCHGVPSPLVWKDYLLWQERKNRGKCVKVDFRNKKKYGWDSHIESLTIDKKTKVINIDSKVYTNIFYSELAIRPACYYCPYKSINRVGNISIGDYWGIDAINSKFNDKKGGVSLVLINDEKGKNIFENIKDKIIYEKTNIEDSLQQPLINPFPEPNNRELFWKRYNKYSFNKIAKKYGQYGIKWQIKSFLRKIKRKINKK